MTFLFTIFVTPVAPSGCSLWAEAGAKLALERRRPSANLWLHFPSRKHRGLLPRCGERMEQPPLSEGQCGCRGPWWIPRATRLPTHPPPTVVSFGSASVMN